MFELQTFKIAITKLSHISDRTELTLERLVSELKFQNVEECRAESKDMQAQALNNKAGLKAMKSSLEDIKIGTSGL